MLSVTCSAKGGSSPVTGSGGGRTSLSLSPVTGTGDGTPVGPVAGNGVFIQGGGPMGMGTTGG